MQDKSIELVGEMAKMVRRIKQFRASHRPASPAGCYSGALDGWLQKYSPASTPGKATEHIIICKGVNPASAPGKAKYVP